MKRAHLRRATGAWLASLLLLGPGLARAEAPQGAYTLSVTGSGALLVPTGGTEVCQTSRGIEVCASSAVETNGLGGLLTAAPGGQMGELTLAGDALTATLTLFLKQGTLSGTTQRPKASLAFRATGTITEGGQAIDAIGLGRLRCALDPSTADALACRGRATLCAVTESGEEIGCTAVPVATRITLEVIPFDLEFDLATNEDGIVTGSGGVAFSETMILPRAANGRYSARTDTTSLTLTGFDASNKISVKGAVFGAGTLTGGKIVYKIAGQKGVVEPQ